MHGKYTVCISRVYRGQKRALHSLELELETAVNIMWLLESLGPLQEWPVFFTPESFILSLLFLFGSSDCFYVYECYVCMLKVPGAHRGQK